MPEKPLYRIRAWAETFERAQSRRVNNLSWFAMPNRFDSKRLQRLTKMEGGDAHFGIFCLMLELTSRLSSSRRGYLEDSDGPMGAEEMALVTGFPVSSFERTIPVLLTVGLLELSEPMRADIPAMSVVIEAMSENVNVLETQENTLAMSALIASRSANISNHLEKNRGEEKRADKNGFAPDCARFAAEYPVEVPQVAIQLFIGKVNSSHTRQDLLFANLALYKASAKWKRGMIPAAENWLSKGFWEVAPKEPKASDGMDELMERLYPDE